MMRLPALRRPRARVQDRDRGSVTLYFLVFGVVMMGILALVVDGGRLLAASADTDDLAAEAARAAGQQINGPDAVQGRRTIVDPAAAKLAAQTFLAQSHASGDVQVSPDGQTLTITVHATYTPLLLSAFGSGGIPVTGHATATLVRTPGA